MPTAKEKLQRLAHITDLVNRQGPIERDAVSDDLEATFGAMPKTAEKYINLLIRLNRLIENEGTLYTPEQYEAKDETKELLEETRADKVTYDLIARFLSVSKRAAMSKAEFAYAKELWQKQHGISDGDFDRYLKSFERD